MFLFIIFYYYCSLETNYIDFYIIKVIIKSKQFVYATTTY